MVFDGTGDSSGLEAAPDSVWDGHVLLLHGSERERLAGLVAWVRRGLDQDEKVIYTEGTVEPDQSVLTALSRRGIAVDAAMADGRLALLPLAEYFPPDGQERVVQRALAEGFPAVRMSAEANAARTMLSAEAYAAAEWAMDALCRSYPLSTMCQYGLPVARGPLLREVVAEHVAGIRQAAFSTHQDGPGLALRGELDYLNADVLAAVVVAMGTKPGRVWLDFAEVDFVDVAACRALVESSEPFRQAGGVILVVAPQPSVERTMGLLGLDRLPGLELVGDVP